MQSPFKKSFRVYFGDTDAAGVVHHARYIYWLEAARIDYLDHIGMPYIVLQNRQIGLMPVDISIQYKKSLVFNDCFDIEIYPSHIGKASVTLQGNVIKDSICYCKSRVKLACIDEQTWKPLGLPDELISHMSSL